MQNFTPLHACSEVYEGLTVELSDYLSIIYLFLYLFIYLFIYLLLVEQRVNIMAASHMTDKYRACVRSFKIKQGIDEHRGRTSRYTAYYPGRFQVQI